MIQSRQQLLCTVSPPVSVVFLLQVVHPDAAVVLHVDFMLVSLLQTHNLESGRPTEPKSNIFYFSLLPKPTLRLAQYLTPYLPYMIHHTVPDTFNVKVCYT